MLKQTDTKITRYTDETMGGAFYVDIMEADRYRPYREAWLTHKDYGVSMHMFGVPAENSTEEDFIKMVEANLVEYEVSYMREYMDE